MAILYRVEGSLAVLSMVGSLLIIISAMFVKTLRQHPSNLVLLLACCDFIFALKYGITAVTPDSKTLTDNDGFCLTQAIWTQFFGLASISWNGIISINLLINLRYPFVDTSKYEKFYHVYVWTLVTLATGFMIGFDEWGPTDDGTCWVPSSASLFRLTFFIPLACYFIFGVLAFGAGIVAASYMTSQNEMQVARRRMVFRMFFYVAVFVTCWSGPMANKLAEYYGERSSILEYADAVGVSIQGFANAMVWLSNPAFFNSFKKNVLRRLDIFGLFIKTDEAKIPLLGEQWNDFLDNESSDMQRYDVVLRKSVISYLVYAMHEAAEAAKPKLEHDLNPNDFSERKEYDQLKVVGQGFTQFGFVDFAPLPFQSLRDIDGISPDKYLESLQPERFIQNLANQKWSEGRSGSFFCYSPDKRFIIKTLPSNEGKLIGKILPSYYAYILENPNSLIVRIYGCHVVKLFYGDKIFVMVMANTFNTQKKIHEPYDLKGSWVNRHAKTDPPKLGMDVDLRRRGRKLYVRPEQRDTLLQQIEKDAYFLCSLGIMDYSILLGIHFTDSEGEPEHKPSLPLDVSNDSTTMTDGFSDDETLAISITDTESINSHTQSSFSYPSPFLSEKKGKARDITSPRNHAKQQQCTPGSSDESWDEEQGRYQGPIDRPMGNTVGSPVAPSILSSSVTNSVPDSPSWNGAPGTEPWLATGRRYKGDEAPTRKKWWHRSHRLRHGIRARRTKVLKAKRRRKRLHEDGLAAAENRREVYFVGIIDILQLYDANKKAERCWKVYFAMKSKTGISVQAPEFYRDRFITAAQEIIVSPLDLEPRATL